MKRFAPLLAIFALLFSGCINYEQHTELNEDGSGRVFIHYSIAENILSWMSDGKLSFTEDKVRQQYTGEGVTIDDLKITTEAADSSRHVRVVLIFDNVSQLSHLDGFKDMEFKWLREGDQFRFTHSLGASSSSGDESLDAFTVRYSYSFPGEIIESNADSISERTAYWKFKISELNQDHTITATIAASTGGEMVYIFIVIGAVVLLIVVFALLRKLNKK